VRVRSTRLVSLESRHVLATTYEVTMLDHAAPIVISSQLVNRQDVRPSDEPAGESADDPRLGRRLSHRVLLCRDRRAEGRSHVLAGALALSSTAGLLLTTFDVAELEKAAGEPSARGAENGPVA
jgi:hypothetical protein